MSRIARKLEMYGHNCRYCLIPLDENNFSIDHIVPKSQGGSNDKSNKVAACKNCNKHKGSRSVEEFLLRFDKRIKLAIRSHPRVRRPVIEPIGVKPRADWIY